VRTLLWLVLVAVCAVLGYRLYSLQADYEAERQFSYEKMQSLLAETSRLEETIARARVARNPRLVSLPEEKTIDVSGHNTLLVEVKGLPPGTRLSATIFDGNDKPALTHPTLSVQKGNLVVYPLAEGSLPEGQYELRLFHEAKLLSTYRLTAVGAKPN
jgi:hypothetical protein